MIGLRAWVVVTMVGVGCVLVPGASADSRLVAVESESDAGLPCGDSAGHMDCGYDDSVVTLRSDGGGRHRVARRLTADQFERIQVPAWSPDGRRIAFLRGLRPATVSPDGTHLHLPGPSCCFDSISWARRGSGLLMGGSPTETADDGVYEWLLTGKRLRRLTHGPDSEPAASSTGGVAFVRRRAGGAARIYLIRRPGTAPHPFVTGANPDWAPDGRRLVFERADGLYTVAAAGGRPRRLTRTPDDREPAWSPDGSRIAFVRYPDLWVVRRDGSQARRITRGAHPNTFWASPSWRP